MVRDSAEPVRNLSVFVGGSFVDENSQQDYTVNGFCTPTAGVVNGKVSISAIEGDANLVGDQLLIAATGAGPFKNLSGPNNPAGQLLLLADQRRRRATSIRRAPSASPTTTPPRRQRPRRPPGLGRHHRACLLQAGQLQNGQTSAVLRTITTGDSYIPTLAAFAIDVNAPDFTGPGSKLATSVNTAKIGDKITVTVDLVNKGQVTAQKVLLTLPIEAGLSLTQFQIDGQNGDINGAPVTAAGLGAGVDAGTLGAGKTRHVVLDLDVVGPPTGAQYLLQADWAYAFQLCAGATLPESFSQFGFVAFDGSGTTASSGETAAATTGTSSGAGGATSGATTSSGSGGNSGSGGDGAGGDSKSAAAATAAAARRTPGADSGCGCSLPGTPERPWAPAALALLALTGLLRPRRRDHR